MGDMDKGRGRGRGGGRGRGRGRGRDTDTLDKPPGSTAGTRAAGNTADNTQGSTAGKQVEGKGNTVVVADKQFFSLEQCPTLSPVHVQFVRPACTNTL